MDRDLIDNDEPPKEVLDKEAEKFRQLLLREKNKLLKNAQRTLTEDMTIDQDDLPDEMDLSAADYNQSLTFRLRGRERLLMNKIESALQRLDSDEFFWCQNCGDFIGLKRLEARPVTTLCIRCKEREERHETVHSETRGR